MEDQRMLNVTIVTSVVTMPETVQEREMFQDLIEATTTTSTMIEEEAMMK